MEQLSVSRFCSLATSTGFQTWLFEYSQSLYRDLMHHIRRAKGCNANTEKMHGLLKQIEEQGGIEQLYAFLKVEYPDVFEQPTRQLGSNHSSLDRHGVFGGFYNPGLLPFPRRLILKGSASSLATHIEAYQNTNAVVDFLIIEDLAYIEYVSDRAIADRIPDKNWLIKKFRQKNVD